MSLTELLEGLKKEYIAALPDRIAEIKKQYSNENAEALTSEFHKLKGTGTTYGIPEISELGELVEGHCQHKPDKAKDFIPIAIELLEEIYQSRTKKCSFDIRQDQRFQKLLATP